jgi:hypothetical protein
MKRALFLTVWFMFTAAALIPGITTAEEVTNAMPSATSPWHWSVRVGAIDFEGDEELSPGPVGLLSVAYDYSARWIIECSVYGAPQLEASEGTMLGWDNLYMLGAAVDAVFHLSDFERVDPYLSFGIGYSYYSEELEGGNQDDIILRGGLGVTVPLNDRWAARADFQGMLADYGGAPNANAMAVVGLMWTWCERTEPPAPKTDVDADGDGLSFEEEGKLGTDYLNPDTDGDGVSDGDEVKRNTDPLKKD